MHDAQTAGVLMHTQPHFQDGRMHMLTTHMLLPAAPAIHRDCSDGCCSTLKGME
jgi:hypothetical protein